MTATDPRSTAQAALLALGWDTTTPSVREVTVPALNGSNLLFTTPPCPATATPLLAALVERVNGGGSVLVLSPEALLAEWTGPITAACRGAALRPLVLRSAVLAAQRFAGPPGHPLMATTPATAAVMRQRSLLPAGGVAAVVIAWPENWEDTEVLTTILADVPKDAQRVILTAAPEQVAALAERHAWRAATAGERTSVLPVNAPIQVVSCPWDRRIQAVADLLDRQDVPSVTVWTADARHHAALQAVLAAASVPGTVASGVPAPAALVIAFDPPSPADLQALTAAGRTCLLMPPGTERYLARIAPAASPIVISPALEAAQGDADRRRTQVAEVVTRGGLDEGLLLLAPLFERHDPTAVASALYRLWREAERAVPAATTAPATAARVWVSGGKKDAIGPNDLVGLLTRDLHVERAAIGRIEIRETFSLIEVPAPDAARIAAALTGRSLRQRRLLAKVDQPREGAGGLERERPARRTPPRPRPR